MNELDKAAVEIVSTRCYRHSCHRIAAVVLDQAMLYLMNTVMYVAQVWVSEKREDADRKLGHRISQELQVCRVQSA